MPPPAPDVARYMVRLEFRLPEPDGCRVGYRYPATRFTTGEHAERFGMCLWAARYRDVVAVHVFPPVIDRGLASDGWSIAKAVHVDCRTVLVGGDVPTVEVVRKGRRR